MAKKITYADKIQGGLWRHQDANEVKNVVNSLADDITSLQSQANAQQQRTDSAVLSVPQTLTKAQKEQAQRNIGVEGVQTVYLDDLDFLTDSSLFINGPKARYVVLYKYRSMIDFKIGVLDMFSDSMGHVLTQVLTTTQQIDEDGQMTTGHQDNNVNQYYRSYNKTSPTLSEAKNSWTRWRYLNTQKADFDDLQGQVDSIRQHAGIIEFEGFVDDAVVREMSMVEENPQVYFIKEKKTFCISTNGVTFFNNFMTPDESLSIRDYQTFAYMNNSSNKPSPWPMHVYRCKEDGVSYMWNGTEMIPLFEPAYHVEEDMEVTITPEVLHHWDKVTAIGVTLSEGHASGKEYKLEFTVDAPDFTIEFSHPVRWMNDEEPEWEEGWTYQISIQDGLAVAGGWPQS